MRPMPLPLLLMLWYASSAATSISTKEILISFPFPVAVAAIQQLISATFGRAGVSAPDTLSPNAFTNFKRNLRAIAPVSVSMVISLVAYRWSLLSASVSFTCIIKTLAPLFTMIFSYLVANEPTTWTRCASVIPVVIGVALTSATEVEFSLPGALAALVATASQALQMVLAKRMLSTGGWTKADLFYYVAVSGFVTLLFMVILFESRDLYASYTSPGSAFSRRAACGWILLNGLCSFVNQYAGLSVLDRFSTPLSHALANVLKRAVVVILAMTHAQIAVTPLHLCGAVLSVFGALAYQQAVRWGVKVDGGAYTVVPMSDGDDCMGMGGMKRVASENTLKNDPMCVNPIGHQTPVVIHI